MENDTICRQVGSSMNGVTFMTFCYIRHGRASSKKELLNWFSAYPKNSDSVNFEPEESADLIYTVKGNILTVKLLYVAESRKFLIEPDTFTVKGNRIILKEKNGPLSDKPMMLGSMVDEAVYVFRKADSTPVAFRHVWKL